MSTFMKLWSDDGGGVLCIEIILVGTVLGCGVITGLSTLRDAVITELADLAEAIGTIDQGFTIHGVTSPSSSTTSTSYVDTQDVGDNGATQGEVSNSRCLVIGGESGAQVLPSNENRGG